MWLALLYFIGAFTALHRQKYALAFALVLICLGNLYPGAYFIFVDAGLLIVLWLQRPTRILIGGAIAAFVTLFTFTLMPYSSIPAYYSFSHYFLSVALTMAFSEDSLIGLSAIMGVFYGQIALGLMAIYDVITGYKALKKAGLIPRPLLRLSR
ncbi:hypothetical protein HPY42_00040 [Coprothermobacteraceae bacterium]|nr:hypothetical protein [Coprothermobacteraceae bacterium]